MRIIAVQAPQLFLALGVSLLLAAILLQLVQHLLGNMQNALWKQLCIICMVPRCWTTVSAACHAVQVHNKLADRVASTWHLVFLQMHA